jgi:hypothetical protein
MPSTPLTPFERAIADAARACRGTTCKSKIVWAVNEEKGTPIPLDSKAPCYEIYVNGEGTICCRPARDVRVTHFATCRNPEQFSKGGGGR